MGINTANMADRERPIFGASIVNKSLPKTASIKNCHRISIFETILLVRARIWSQLRGQEGVPTFGFWALEMFNSTWGRDALKTRPNSPQDVGNSPPAVAADMQQLEEFAAESDDEKLE